MASAQRINRYVPAQPKFTGACCGTTPPTGDGLCDGDGQQPGPELPEPEPSTGVAFTPPDEPGSALPEPEPEPPGQPHSAGFEMHGSGHSPKFVGSVHGGGGGGKH
jgi:hypothetical protein